MLRMDNFLSFAIVNGFFIGLLLSFLKFDDPEMIIIGTLISTISFYLIVLLSSSLFIKFLSYNQQLANKPSYNERLEEYIAEFDKREKATNKIRRFLRTMEKTLQDEEIIQRQNHKSEQKNNYAKKL